MYARMCNTEHVITLIDCRLMAASLVTREMLSKSNKFADQFCKWASDVVRKIIQHFINQLSD